VPAKRILVVDDEPNVVKTCARMLELEGFAVRGATDGSEAVDLYRREHFDLVLTDLKMPGMDGLRVLETIKLHNPRAAVAILTAYGTKENVVEALKLGACEFLEKPLDAKTLVAAVRRTLDSRDASLVQGNLRSMSLPNIIQVNCAENSQAHLRIRNQGQEASIFFADGNVVHAVLGSQAGEEAVYELLTWEDGDFELEMDVPPPERTINVGWSGLLLEGLRRLDEEAAGMEELEAGQREGVVDEMTQELVRALRQIDGVVGVVFAARDGIVLADDLDGDPLKEGAVTVFVGNAASQVGESLALGAFDWGTVVVGKDTVLVLEQPDCYVGLLLSERASPALVASSAQSVLV
jgi:DNA-binding response OmpR family regulator/predicted regulator of Ras-like GTPase activity (Roadblock/LC7/MglB family)